MFNNRKDDDVIVLSEEDITYETPAENDDSAVSAGSPAGDDTAAHDQSARPVSGETGRFGTVTMPGDAAATPETDSGPAFGGPASDSPASDATFGSGDDSSAADSVSDDDPADDPADAPVTAGAGSYGTTAQTPADSGLAASDTPLVADDDVEADGTGIADGAHHDTQSADRTAATAANGTVNGAGNGSAIPMPGAAPAAADAPVAASATPVTPVTPATPATPAASPAAAADSSWPQIQALFVDDPQSAVRQAADVAGGAVAALVAAARNREQAMRDTWQSDSTGTEDLRTALRGYRDLAGRLSALSKDL